MKKSKKITFYDKELDVHELEVRQVTEWLDSIKDEPDEMELHPLDLMMGRAIPVAALRIAIPDLTDDDLGKHPSEIDRLYTAVEEMNPFLSRMATGLLSVAEAGDIQGKP